MKNSIKREQSQACLNFAERKNFRLQAKYKIIMTLALLLTAVTGAWAEETPLVTIYASSDFTSGSKTFDNKVTATFSNQVSFIADNGWCAVTAGNKTLTFEPVDGVTITRVKFYTTLGNAEDITAPFEAIMNSTYVYVSGNSQACFHVSVNGSRIGAEDTHNYLQKIEVYGTAEPPIEVAWDPATKTGSFYQPGSDVVLTPIYAAATLYQNDGETEKQAYETLKEAFANVQDGDVIKLDWNVTLTEDLATPTIEGGVKFTLDFNGYTLDFGTTYQIKLQNDGDQLTFTDSSDDQLGGLIAENFNIKAGREYVFVAGRYNICGTTAERLNVFFCANPSIPFSVAEGKEFVDLEGGAEANDGFTVRVGFKTYELTIGAGKFATFYADQNTTLDEGQNIGFYTISSIDADRSTATVTQINSTIIPANTPTLVYNGGNDQQTVKIKVTPDEADAENQGISPLENFMGTAVAKTFTEDDMAAADYYALSGGKLFVPVYDAGTIGKNQCWLQFNHANGAPARGITLVFEKEEATEVTEVLGKPSDQGRASEVNEAGDGAWYDLSGRKLNAAPIKGVYIKDGKKIVK